MGGEAECSMMQFGDVVSSVEESKLSTTWLADSGASHHIYRERRSFMTLKPFKGKYTIMQVNGELEVKHWGTVLLEVDGKFGKEKLLLENELFLECSPLKKNRDKTTSTTV